jgi:apyrase
MEESRPKQYFIRSIINFLQGVAFTIFLLAIIITIYILILYHIRLTPVTNYAIVFDAGSSHTEMFVYHWPADKSNGLGTTSAVNEYFVCPLNATYTNDTMKKGEPTKLKAISDFEQNLDLLEGYFRPCLNEAIERIPGNRHKTSPIFLGATAGMRLSRLRNVTRAKQVLEAIREIFSNSPFQFVVARQVNSSKNHLRITKIDLF